MRVSFNRRTAIKVKDSRVQRKNRHKPTAHNGYVLDHESPGRGFRHVLSKRDLQAFIGIIPDWGRLSERLERIVLSAAKDGCDAEYSFYHREETGAIFLHAWHEDLWVELRTDYFNAHEAILTKLGVSFDRREKDVLCRFTESQARAFMLLHVFLHELGHHYDRSRQKHLGATKGEQYAETFAVSRFSLLFPEYVRVFGDPVMGNG